MRQIAQIDRISEGKNMQTIVSNLPFNVKLTQDDIYINLQKMKKEKQSFQFSFIIEDQIGNEVTYSINICKIINIFQVKILEKIIENKYSQNHARIIRILLRHQNLDDKKISELALLSLKETRSILMELFSEHLISLDVSNLSQNVKQEISTQNITRYSLDIKTLYKTVLQSHYQCIYNLRVNQENLMQQLNSDLLYIKQREDEFQEVQKKIQKIEMAIIEVSRELMYLNDF